MASPTPAIAAGPLSGIRILDLGLAGVGPYAAGLLAQLGADVIKCEPPWGDIINRSGGSPGGADRPAPMYVATNLSKRGMTLNLKDHGDRQTFLSLVATADVYMENMKAGAADHLGIGYDALSKVNPALVWVNSSGFGDTGPLREMGSFEQYSDALSGASSVTGDRGGQPRRLPGMRIDPFTACCLATMVLTGLASREISGRGQKIVGSQFGSALQFGMVRAFEALNLPRDPGPWGTEHPHIVPSRVFSARDGRIGITAQTESQWRNLCVVLQRPDLMFEPRFRNNEQRVDHRDELYDHLAPLFVHRTVEEWVEALQARRVPSGASLSQHRHLVDPHIIATKMLVTVETQWGPITTPGTPAKFSRTPTRLEAGPRHGEHTDEILRELAPVPDL